MNRPVEYSNTGFSATGTDELHMLLAAAEEELRDVDARRASIIEQIAFYENALSSPWWWPTDLIRKIILFTVGKPEKLLSKEELRDIDARRASIIEQITLCKNALSLPQWWPTELIREIMLFTVGTRETFLSVKDDPRLSISQICTRWREIAFDTPEIWDVDLEMYPIRNRTDGLFKLIGAWFSRCSGSRLSLKADIEEGLLAQKQELIRYVIVPNSHLLQQLHLRASCNRIQSILALPSNSFTALEDVILEVGGSSFDPFFWPSIHSDRPMSADEPLDYSPIKAATAFISAPCLREGVYTKIV